MKKRDITAILVLFVLIALIILKLPFPFYHHPYIELPKTWEITSEYKSYFNEDFENDFKCWVKALYEYYEDERSLPRRDRFHFDKAMRFWKDNGQLVTNMSSAVSEDKKLDGLARKIHQTSKDILIISTFDSSNHNNFMLPFQKSLQENVTRRQIRKMRRDLPGNIEFFLRYFK